jgi:hypothetical protein
MGQIAVVPFILGGALLGMGCDYANAKLNDRPYNFRIQAGIYDTPETRYASGNSQNDSLLRIMQNKKEEEERKKRELEQALALQRQREQERAFALQKQREQERAIAQQKQREQERAIALQKQREQERAIALQRQKEQEIAMAAQRKRDGILNLASGLAGKQNQTSFSFRIQKLEAKSENSRVDELRVKQAMNEMENEQRHRLLCPPQLQELAKDIINEIAVDLISHGSAASVASPNSEEYQKFREFLQKKQKKIK